MKAIVILDEAKFNNSIIASIASIANTRGISNLVSHKTKHTITLHFSTHNALEGLREKLIALGLDFELTY